MAAGELVTLDFFETGKTFLERNENRDSCGDDGHPLEPPEKKRNNGGGFSHPIKSKRFTQRVRRAVRLANLHK